MLYRPKLPRAWRWAYSPAPSRGLWIWRRVKTLAAEGKSPSEAALALSKEADASGLPCPSQAVIWDYYSLVLA